MINHKTKPPLIPQALIKLFLKGEDFREFSGDIDEIYQYKCACGSKRRAKLWFWLRVLESIPGIIRDIVYWRSIMIKNYLKIALRNFQRHKGYSFINIAGFAIGMAVCLLILIYVRQEQSYDTYHQDGDRVYRIVQDIRTQTSNRVFAMISPMVAPTLKADYPQVEQAGRALLAYQSRLVRREDTFFYEDRFMYADPELFDVLTIPFSQGNSQEALKRPRTLVISERMTLKYFGHDNPLGKTLEINNEIYEITGVVADPPENTHLKYDLIASMETLRDWEEMSNWYSTMFYTYLKLKPNVNGEEFSQQVSNLADKYVGEQLREMEDSYHYFLQPVSRIHLHSHLRYETEPSGNPLYDTIFSFVGLFILLIACLNFMNLSTAQAANRAREVGMRKVVGARRFQLIGQFLGESLLVTIFSLGLAIVLAKFAMPLINNVTGIALNFDQILNPVVLAGLIAGSIGVGLATGVYPALVLSAFRPISTLKGNLARGSRGFAMRNGLVVVQFAISVVLIVGTLIMVRQFNYMKNQHLGFEKEQKLVLPIRGGISILENYESVKNLFSENPFVQNATVSSSVPGRGVSNFGVSLVGEEDPKNQSMFHLYFDQDFIPLYGIEMVAGRAFQKEMSTDIAGAFLINEAAVAAFGWSSPEKAIGKRLKTGFGGRVNPIIGVTKNFHYRGLQTQVEPLVMEYNPQLFRYLTLSIDIADIKEIMAIVESQWKSLYPNNPFESFFLDTDFDQQYRSDEQVGKIFGIFTVLGLCIACLGLLGLASFTAESRTKEIGIRKVLGASVLGIAVMLSKQFTKWVLLANVIAWPAAYYIMSRWLKNFAYRTDINILIFVLSGLLVLAIALLTVSFQSIRAASTNPAESLRYE
jgi:putative ABC transport system permease protein